MSDIGETYGDLCAYCHGIGKYFLSPDDRRLINCTACDGTGFQDRVAERTQAIRLYFGAIEKSAIDDELSRDAFICGTGEKVGLITWHAPYRVYPYFIAYCYKCGNKEFPTEEIKAAYDWLGAKMALTDHMNIVHV